MTAVRACRQSLLCHPARLQKAREVAALAQLWDAQFDHARPPVPIPRGRLCAATAARGAFSPYPAPVSAPTPAPSTARPQNPSYPAACRHQRSSQASHSAPSSHRSSGFCRSRLRLATQTQPRSPIPIRNAARTASQAKAQRGRPCCQRATPCGGTRSLCDSHRSIPGMRR